jgi:hypothetical protein
MLLVAVRLPQVMLGTEMRLELAKPDRLGATP